VPYHLRVGIALFLYAPAWAAPLQYLTGAGEKAAPVVALTWGLIAISPGVIAIFTALLAGAMSCNVGPRATGPA